MLRVLHAAALLLLLLSSTTADAIPRSFQATLTISIPGLATCISDPPPGHGACGHELRFDSHVSGMTDVSLTPGGVLSQIALAAGLFTLHGTRYIDSGYGPSVHPIHSVAVDQAGNGAGSFGPTGGVMPLAGFFKYCLFGDCADAVANLSVPLSVIGTGATAVMTGPVNLTVVGAPWTIGTITAGYTPAQLHGGSGSGHLELVTPIYVSTNLAGGSEVTFAYARLSIDFVPEPTTAMLVGLGTLLLAATGRSHRR